MVLTVTGTRLFSKTVGLRPPENMTPFPEASTTAGTKYVHTSCLKRLESKLGLERWPLARLETFMPFQNARYEGCLGLQTLEPFMPLPKFGEIYGTRCIAVFDGKYRYLHSVLAMCRALKRFFHMPRNLKSSGGHQTKWRGYEHGWVAGDFFRAIANCVGGTLRELVARVAVIYGDILVIVDDLGMDSIGYGQYCLHAGAQRRNSITRELSRYHVLPIGNIRSTLIELLQGFKGEWAETLKHPEPAPVGGHHDMINVSSKEPIALRDFLEDQGIRRKDTVEFEGIGWARGFSSRFNIRDEEEVLLAGNL
ncbi:uncharacterized protein BDR25DRAFT_354191 [Lindgomyces ingoldianus]|uniref:Uncharacterized protein n=1 Tax=Lindgomyces ingoldianus TaxID=673940 RepID=A0ACB6QXC1_9PLEO|nr:uncharacterized protein BDR25DRAFT_354191 [Lindgomyces ingoldianus]KAF2471694.1 hypothetical protein BDR25DRAFT_354191 [Lindgomyces ingoldianus]